jgi:hypothetical protein
MKREKGNNKKVYGPNTEQMKPLLGFDEVQQKGLLFFAAELDKQVIKKQHKPSLTGRRYIE